jgi:Heparinase II/III-like protein
MISFFKDKLNVIISSYGRFLLYDSGGGNYEDSIYRAFSIETGAHNTIMVDSIKNTQNKINNLNKTKQNKQQTKQTKKQNKTKRTLTKNNKNISGFCNKLTTPHR